MGLPFSEGKPRLSLLLLEVYTMLLLKGEYYIKTHASKEQIRFLPGEQNLLPHLNPYAEGNAGNSTTVLLVKLSPVPDKKNLTIDVSEGLCNTADLPNPAEWSVT